MYGVTILLDSEGKIFRFSDHLPAYLGLDGGVLYGKTLPELKELFTAGGGRPEEDSIFDLQLPVYGDYSCIAGASKGGMRRMLFCHCSTLIGGEGSGEKVFAYQLLDITERRSDYKAQVRLNRVFRTISEIRSAITSVTTEEQLYKETCRLVVGSGYPFAWIGLRDPEDPDRIVPVAHSGPHGDYLEGLTVSLTDSRSSPGPTARSILERKPVSFENLNSEEDFDPWREKALERGFHSSLSVPLLVGESIIGSLNIYSLEEGSFDSRETDLFVRLLGDLSLGIERIRMTRLQESARMEREAMQEAMIRLQKMEAIGTMAGGIAHDFNNLLNVIKGYTQILLLQSGENREDLLEIDRAARRAADLTRQILLLGKQPVKDLRPFALNKLIEKNVAMIRRMSEDRIQFQLSLDPGLSTLQGNEGQIDQVVLNLILNAMDSIPDRGSIFVSTERKNIGPQEVALIPGSRVGEYLILSVEDTGTGIPESILERIFDPFYTTKDPGKGTGMGLAVAQSVIAMHGGWINVYSEPGKGSSFRIYLPLKKEDLDISVGKSRIGGSPVSTGKENRWILVLEDDRSIRHMIGRFLESKGFRISLAANVREALDLFEAHGDRFDLVFSDVVLPDGDGLSAAEAMRKMNKKMRFLFASGYTAARARFHDIQLRGYAFIQKPYDLEFVMKEIYRCLEEPVH